MRLKDGRDWQILVMLVSSLKNSDLEKLWILGKKKPPEGGFLIPGRV